MSTTNPSASASASPSQAPSPPQQNDQHQHDQEHHQQHRLQVHTHHCRFCNHLLLATTRNIDTLPRRKPPAQDTALILPLPHADEDDEEEEPDEEPDADADTATFPTNASQKSEGQVKNQKQKQKHYTILLSTTLPDRKATLIRREDGIEKRRFLRCGRCRVVVGYFLDAVHFPIPSTQNEDGGGNEGMDQEPRVVYLLPGGLIPTERMGDEEKMRVMDREWSGWISQ